MRIHKLAICWPLLVLNGCRAPQSVPVGTIEEKSLPALSTMVHVADPKTAGQLVKGFHGVEQNAWRWTMKEFSVTLGPPPVGMEKASLLRVKLTVPDAVINKVGPVTLSASVEGTPLEPEKYSKSGEYAYSRDVPAEALRGDVILAEFSLDKAIPAGPLDRRELGIVVSSIGLESK
jgi:hypothetical protein